MKLSLVAFAAVTTFAVANAAVCDPVKLAPLLADSNVAKCTADSGFSFANPTRPTSEMTTKFCASDTCKAMLSRVEGLGLGDCTLFGMQLQSDLITPTQNACAGNSGSRGNAAGSAAGSAGNVAPIVGNSTTNNTSPATSGGSTGGTASPITNSSNNGSSPNTARTPAPTATPSSASSIAMATSVAFVAVVAAFL